MATLQLTEHWRLVDGTGKWRLEYRDLFTGVWTARANSTFSDGPGGVRQALSLHLIEPGPGAKKTLALLPKRYEVQALEKAIEISRTGSVD